jgi:hypothetical protein
MNSHERISGEDYQRILDRHLVSDMIDEIKEHISADQLIDDLYYAIGKIEMFKALRYIKRVRCMPLSSYVEKDDE